MRIAAKAPAWGDARTGMRTGVSISLNRVARMWPTSTSYFCCTELAAPQTHALGIAVGNGFRRIDC